MAWRYRKRIKVIPGVHLNLSKSGITTSIGIRGASLTFGKNGTYLNTGIPGTGIYQRQKLGGKNPPINNNFILPYNQESSPENLIISADIQEITSQDMHGIKESIILAQQQRKDLENELVSLKKKIFWERIKLYGSYLFLVGLFIKSISIKLKKEIKDLKNIQDELQKQLSICFVHLKIDFDPEFQEAFEHLHQSFIKLCSSHKIWDVTSEKFQDRKVTRSSAGKLVKKSIIKFNENKLPFIQCDYPAFHLTNKNGADFYFYPYFIIMYNSANKFAVIGIDELDFHYGYVRFTETGTVPKDSEIMEYTWAKVNKNGTRDKRFKANYQIPVVKYGEFYLSTTTGVNEEYEISNYNLAKDFGEAFTSYQEMIKYHSPVLKGKVLKS